MTKGKKIDIVNQLKPGRRLCNCQARVHELIRNCLNCGRVVCAQEGSGACFHCGNLVCTREEQKILDAGNHTSYALLKRLTNDSDNSLSLDNIARDIYNSGNNSVKNARDYKEKLLKADKNSNATTVNDMESDYFTLEDNIFLSAEDRDRILQRKQELRQQALERKRKIVFSLDITNAAITEEKQLDVEVANDPIIQELLLNAMRAKEADKNSLEDPAAKCFDGFQPKYVGDNCKSLKSKMPVKTIFEPHWCIALPPSLASQLTNGERSHIQWKEEIHARGFIFVAALALGQSPHLLNEDCDQSSTNLVNHAIVGRAMITDCLTWEEYKYEYPNGECSATDSGFVILFNLQHPLASPFINYSAFSELHLLDKRTYDTLRRHMQGDDTLFTDLIALNDV